MLYLYHTGARHVLNMFNMLTKLTMLTNSPVCPGQVACARRDCSGCCYCSNLPPLPVYLDMRTFRPAGSIANPYMFAWHTLEELRLEFKCIEEDCNRFPMAPIPAYLLNRRDEREYDARIISLSAKVPAIPPSSR